VVSTRLVESPVSNTYILNAIGVLDAFMGG
jgi:hypothetical protein